MIDPFADSYLSGETPIPCVACNQTVKFRDLLETARDLGADALATGHYIASRLAGAHRAMFRPRDLDRDQSYFLYGTTQEQLDFLRFPLGRLTKPETRALAEKHRARHRRQAGQPGHLLRRQGALHRRHPQAAARSRRAGRYRPSRRTRLGRHEGILALHHRPAPRHRRRRRRAALRRGDRFRRRRR